MLIRTYAYSNDGMHVPIINIQLLTPVQIVGAERYRPHNSVLYRSVAQIAPSDSSLILSCPIPTLPPLYNCR